tara:strand:+ start:82 stop:243 length:162 start_codon:yes stop_codon:yes gene_type:complete
MDRKEAAKSAEEIIVNIMGAITKAPTKKGHLEAQDYMAKALQIAQKMKKELSN